MRLIVNADDFGYSSGVNRGILECFERGVVRSATVMANMPAFEEAAEIARRTSKLAVGLHLNLSSGPSLTGRCSLTDDTGLFVRELDYFQVDEKDVEREFDAQMQRLLDGGILPSHIDSHHHVHRHPAIAQVIAARARSLKLPVRPGGRFENPAIVLSTDFSGDVSMEGLQRILLEGKAAGTEFMELMCHPGVADQELVERSSYSYGRERERELLTAPELGDWLERQGIALCSYRDFPREKIVY
ncbi:MAG: carbohydrate deacetylase [Christensenellales bacterium]|jgi:predicted glycoside hydrolase/deacetylase ChbG (UPF0249 family)